MVINLLQNLVMTSLCSFIKFLCPFLLLAAEFRVFPADLHEQGNQTPMYFPSDLKKYCRAEASLVCL